ncbi:salicylate hydroxylase, partial [Metarhizium majus ARSEF 297]
MASKRTVAIVGAGPGGLCLGALLQKQGIPYTIYELRDAPSDSIMSTPSGMLDLHDDAGLAAIRACGLWDQFSALTNDCSQDTLIMDDQGTLHYKDSGSGGNRPEVARNSLTHLLLAANNPEALKWNHKLRRAASSWTGQFTLDFGDNGTFTHDLVVGADGAWSKVRPLVTHVEPQDGGMHYTTLHIPNASERYPHLAGLAGQGTSFLLGGKNGLVTHRGVGGSICLHVIASSSNKDDFAQFEDNTDPAVVRDALLHDPKLFQAWSPAIQELIKTALDNELTPRDPRALNMRRMYMLPVGHTWENIPGVTLMGDAAHLMMPWAGEGVNLAMRDALELSKAIVSAWNEPDSRDASPLSTAEYEKEMFARARASAEETWSNSKILFADNGAKAMADLMASYGPSHE